MRLSRLEVVTRKHALEALEEVQSPVVEQRRGHVGQAAVHAPGDGFAAGEVSFGLAIADGHARRLAIAAHHEYAFGIGDRHGNAVQPQAATTPDLAPRLQIVCAHGVGAAGNDQPAVAVGYDEGRGPRRGFVAPDLPALLARSLVECDDERVALVIPVDDDRVSVHDRRGTFAELVACAHVAEVLVPDQLAVLVQTVQPARAEEGPHVLAVGDRRGRGLAGGDMARLVRYLFTDDALPNLLARVAIDGLDDETVKESKRCFKLKMLCVLQ